MNILLEQLPTTAEIDGVEYELNTDYRDCMRIMLAFEDPELSGYEKNLIMLTLLYKEIPANIKKALEIAFDFLDCGESKSKDNSNQGASANERLFSFEKDAKYIFSAIKQTHGIDLETIDYLHWWKFCYMFMDLREDCFFSQILYYRQQHSRGKLTTQEREIYNRIRDILELPKAETIEDIRAKNEFMRLLNGGD